jgi:hypothetical protein
MKILFLQYLLISVAVVISLPVTIMEILEICQSVFAKDRATVPSCSSFWRQRLSKACQKADTTGSTGNERAKKFEVPSNSDKERYSVTPTL